MVWKKKVPEYVPLDAIKRLSLYLRVLKNFQQSGIEIISSHQITKYLNVPSSQFRKDLSYFGEFGKRGIGYEVNKLVKAIENILGIDRIWKIILVGVGKLGAALLAYPGFSRFNFRFIAAFDIDIGKIGKTWEGVKIEDVSKMEEIIRKENVKVAMLCVPAEEAQKVAEELVKCGIKAILNFAPVNLVLPENVYVSNVDMASELETLIYRLKSLTADK